MTSSSDDVVTIRVFDNCVYPSPPQRFSVTLKPTDTVSTLRQQIVEHTKHKEHAFSIFPLTTPKQPLEDSVVISSIKPPRVSLSRNNNTTDEDFNLPKKHTKGFHSVPHSKEPAPPSPKYSNAIVPYVPAGGDKAVESSSSMSWSSYSVSNWNKKSDTGFVGLSNQGATCYMNSLIQTLFMTPEFRNALYKWDFDDTYNKWRAQEHAKTLNKDIQDLSLQHSHSSTNTSSTESEAQLKERREKESIPRQLQLLFARLQLSEQRAVKTKGLTNSFGWKEADAFTQHDVQELCRVLFDALEKVLKGTEQQNLIKDLYEGELKDYVQCKECNYESSKSDKYLDIPLVIRPFGASTPIKSIEEALDKFVQPELLEGSNQYFCERCNKKVDAVKGLKFASFPYLLALQLKRFDFDYESLRRIKLNDRVTFPMYIDLNKYIDGSAAATASSATTTSTPMEMSVETVSDGEAADVSYSSLKKRRILQGDMKGEEEDMPLVSSPASSSEKSELSEQFNEAKWEEKVKSMLANGPYVYELYSVLIHRGSALGGHYYAYIKSFTDKKWYEFNDSNVQQIQAEELVNSYGEDVRQRYKSSLMQMFHSSSNAYMLMYRRIDSAKNQSFVPNDKLPAELVKRVQQENDRVQKRLKEKQLEREMITLKLHYADEPERTLKVHQSTTLAETTRLCAENVGVNLKYPPDCIRLRVYQAFNGVPLEPLDDPAMMDKTLEQLHFTQSRTLLLETRDPSEAFPVYNPADMLIRVIKYDNELNQFMKPQNIYINRDASLKELKQLLESKFNIPVNFQRLVRESWTFNGPPAKILTGDEEALRDHRVYEASKLYVEYCDDMDSESPSFAEIERTRNMIELAFNLPGSTEFDQFIQVNKKISFLELKQLLQPIVKLPIDDFKVSRGSLMVKFEIKNEQDSLEDCRLVDGSRLIIEKGKPMKEGESRIVFHLFDPSNKTTKDYFEELFEMPVEELILVGHLKQLLVQKLKEEKQIETDASRLVLREVITRAPSTILLDHKTLKDSVTYLYSGKHIAIQLLSEPAPQKSEKDVVPFVQQWFPSKYELAAEKHELVLPEDMTLDALKRLLSQKFNIKNVGLAKPFGWPGPDIIEIPNLDWDREIPDLGSTPTGTVSTAPLYLHDGDILYFRDNDEPLKQLSPEERNKLEKQRSKKRFAYHHKEEALTINVKA